MKKNITFIIILLVITAILFSTAATCNMCGTPVDIGIGQEESSEDEMISEPQRETTGTTQGQSQGTEAPVEGNNPPVIRDIEMWRTDIEVYEELLLSDWIPSAEVEEAEIPFSIEAYDEDGDELTFIAYDSLGTDFNVTKIDNNNAEFTWRNPFYNGSYTLTVEVSDGRGGVVTYAIDMNITDEPSGLIDNDPPEVSEIRIIVPDSGTIITANYVYTSREYELLAIASDPEGSAMHYQWSLEGENGGYCGNINNTFSNPTTWTTPAQGEDTIDQWCIITIRVGDNYNELQSLQRRVHVVTGAGI